MRIGKGPFLVQGSSQVYFARVVRGRHLAGQVASERAALVIECAHLGQEIIADVRRCDSVWSGPHVSLLTTAEQAMWLDIQPVLSQGWTVEHGSRTIELAVMTAIRQRVRSVVV